MVYLEKIVQDIMGQFYKVIFWYQYQAGYIVYIMVVVQCWIIFDGSFFGEVFGLWVDVIEQEELKNKFEVVVLEQ